MIWQMANFVKNPELLDQVQDNDSFVLCHFAQFAPRTRVLSGKRGLSFIKSNLINCAPPPDAKIDGLSNITQNIYEQTRDGIVFVRNLGKRSVKKIDCERYMEILSSDEITNAFVKILLRRQIIEARLAIAMRNPITVKVKK